MRYGYWLPVFGGWLRNVPDEGMDANWRYVSRLARRSGWRLSKVKKGFLIQGTDKVGAVNRHLQKLADAKINVTAADTTRPVQRRVYVPVPSCTNT